MKKTVAIFLALIMSLAACGISAFAESNNPGFTEKTSSEQTSEAVHEITSAEFPLCFENDVFPADYNPPKLFSL